MANTKELTGFGIILILVLMGFSAGFVGVIELFINQEQTMPNTEVIIYGILVSVCMFYLYVETMKTVDDLEELYGKHRSQAKAARKAKGKG